MLPCRVLVVDFVIDSIIYLYLISIFAKNMICLIVALLASLTYSITLSEYEQMEKSKPEVLFESLDLP